MEPVTRYKKLIFKSFHWAALICLLFPSQLQAEWWQGVVFDSKQTAVTSFYEEGQDDWSGQMLTDYALGYKALWVPDSSKGADWYWDFSLSILPGGSTVQSLNTSTENSETRDAPTADVDSFVDMDRLEPVIRLYLPLLDGQVTKESIFMGLAPFVGFGYGIIHFGRFTYRTRGEGVNDLCQQGVETRDADLIESNCEKISTKGTVGLPIFRYGLTYRQRLPSQVGGIYYGIEAPNEFNLGALRVRTQSRYWVSVEMLF